MSATGNGVDVNAEHRANYTGSVSTNAAAFAVPVSIANPSGTVISSASMIFTQTTVGSGGGGGGTGGTSAGGTTGGGTTGGGTTGGITYVRDGAQLHSAMALTSSGYFGQLVVPFKSLPQGAFDITISFPVEKGVSIQQVQWQQPLTLGITIPYVTSDG